MNLNELKKMIAEEYHNYLAEQPADPQIDVDADDIGGEDAEATLKDIFDILKDTLKVEILELIWVLIWVLIWLEAKWTMI